MKALPRVCASTKLLSIGGVIVSFWKTGACKEVLRETHVEAHAELSVLAGKAI